MDDDPLVRAARDLADDLLAPVAADVDAGTVPRSHLDAIGRAGLLGIVAPMELGGTAAAPAVARRTQELLAGADLSTWFVQGQHHFAVRELVRSAGEGTRGEAGLSAPLQALLRELAAGSQLAGVAFSHLRRWPQRPVRATRFSQGWRFDGTAPWYTGWGLNDVAVIGGASEAGEVVFAAVPARASPQLRAGEPMRLAVLQSTVTVRLELAGLEVADDAVIAVRPYAAWWKADLNTAVNANPAVFGVTEAALAVLAGNAAASGELAAHGAAHFLAERLERARQRSYGLVDEHPPGQLHGPRLAARAAAHRLMVEATSAAVISGAGRSMALASPAQRLAREALFLLVQAQTAAAREAALAHWADPDG